MACATQQAPCRRNAGKDAFLARQAPAHVLGILLAHEDQFVHSARVVDLGQVFLRPLADAGDARALAGLRANDADRRVLLLQESRNSRDGARGAHGRDEVRDAPAGLLPQFRAGRLVVDARVVGVGELVQYPALARLLHGLGQITREFHAPAFGSQDQFGTKGLHRLRPFDRQILRHDQHHAVALDGGRHRQRNAGVAGGRFNQGVARLDFAALLGAPDHRQRRPIFNRACRVVALQLAQNHVATRQVRRRANTLQRHQGRSANRILDRRIVHPSHCAIISLDLPEARVVKLVDAPDSKSGSERSVGSIPTPGTIGWGHLDLNPHATQALRVFCCACGNVVRGTVTHDRLSRRDSRSGAWKPAASTQ
jgi:hypothetical protein